MSHYTRNQTFSATQDDGSVVSIDVDDRGYIILSVIREDAPAEVVNLRDADFVAPVLSLIRDDGRRFWREHKKNREEDDKVRADKEAARSTREAIVIMIRKLQGHSRKGVTVEAIAGTLNMSTRTVQDHIKALEEQGMAIRSGEGNRGSPYTWSMADDIESE